jgi:hypothetical protein
MSSLHESQPISAQLRVLRIIIAALMAGVAIALVCAVVFIKPPPNDTGAIVEVIALAALAGAAVGRFLLPPLIDSATRRQVRQQVATLPADARPRETVSRLIQGYMGRTIIAAAIAESAGFMGVAACFIRPSPIGIGVALAGIALIATLWPTRVGIENWLEDQLRRIELEA